jgi:hypothetical protein
MLKLLAATTLLALGLTATPAYADPVSGILFLASAVGVSVGAASVVALSAFFAAYGLTLAVVALNVYGASSARRKARRESERARREYNSNLTDRAVTVLQPDPPWRVVYGRCIAGGDIVAIFTSDKPSTKSDGTPYTKPDAYKHLVIHLASHEVEAIHDVLIDGVRIGTLDANGWVVSTSAGTGKDYTTSSTLPIGSTSIPVAAGTGTILAGDEVSFSGDSKRYRVTVGITAAGQTLTIAAPGLETLVSSATAIQLGNEFTKKVDGNRDINLAAGASFTSATPILSVLSSGRSANSLVDGDNAGWVDSPYTLTGGGFTLTNTGSLPATISYTTNGSLSSIRVLKHLGGTDQTVDTVLSGMFPDKWTADHRLRGCAYVVVTLDLEEQRFQGGPPQMAFEISGRKVFDPRTGLTAYSNNNALIIRDFLMAPWGFEVVSTDINNAYVIAAANACDVSTTFSSLTPSGSTVTRTEPLYTCNGAFTTNDGPEAVLEELAESMAGYVMYGGEWLIAPGTWTTSAMDLTDDDLDGQISIAQAGAGMDSLFNGAHASYLAYGRTSPSDMVPYQNSTFLAADGGRELWSNFTFPYTDSEARARNLARIFTERNRDGLIIQYPAKMNAWVLRVGERVRVTSAEYGFTNKYFRVTDWQFGINSAVNLTLQEDSAAAYDQSDAVLADPTPNTDLPNPNIVAEIRTLATESGTPHLMRLGDGTIVPRVRVTWAPVTSAYVVPGGRIEVSWQVVGITAWNTISVLPDETSTYLNGVLEGTRITVRAVVVNSIGVRSNPVFTSHLVVGKTAPPSDVANIAATVSKGIITWSWDACNDLDYAETQARIGGTDWASAAPEWTGSANRYSKVVSAVGTYTLRVRHVDASGNLSTGTAVMSVPVTVTDIAQDGQVALTIEIFQQAASAPATPTGGSYTFSTNTLVPPAGWTRSRPTSSTTPTWATTFLFITSTPSSAVTAGTWASPVKVAQDGAPGANGTSGTNGVTPIIGYLTNDSYSVATINDGSGGDYSGAGGIFKVFNGITDVTGASVTYSVQSSSGISGLTINSAGVYSLTGTSADTGTATLRAIYSGVTIDKVYSISRSKAGAGGAGSVGASGTSVATVYMYQWSTVQPSNPTASSTFTWATAANASYTGTNGWQTGLPANPGTPGVLLWVAQKSISAAATTTSSTVDWTTGVTVSALSANGANGTAGGAGATGANGARFALAQVFQWAATIPTISGSNTYQWATSTFTAAVPSGWSTSAGASPSTGFTLWQATVKLVDTLTVSSSSVDWTTASISAIGYAGANGADGADGSAASAGASARIAYAKSTSNPLAGTPTTFNTSGSSTFPSTNTWGGAEVWGATVPSFTAGEAVFQINGIYNPTTDITVWGLPYLSSLKVGSLSAISANLGAITAGSLNIGSGTLTMDAAGNLVGRSITIQDSAGNVRFSSGVPLNWANISAQPAGIFNSNVTINANGTLQGGGGGQVTTLPVVDINAERETNRDFVWYSVGTTREFKHAAAIGLSDSDGYWLTLETIKQFTQGGGGYPGYQYAYQQEKTWRRRAADDTGTTFTSWVQDLDRNAYTGELNATYGANTSNAAPGLINSNISIAANGALSGGGGGAVSFAGLGGGSMGLINQITSGNAATYIAAAAIPAALIGSLNVGLLSTAMNPGSSVGRVEMQTNVIRVYDSSNNLRVKIGYLL